MGLSQEAWVIIVLTALSREELLEIQGRIWGTKLSSPGGNPAFALAAKIRPDPFPKSYGACIAEEIVPPLWEWWKNW